ncbi:paralemmin 1a isoform 2-T2 [Spinachia spinachia]
MNKAKEATDEMKRVVHEMNGEDGVQPLSSSEVEELITKADQTPAAPQAVAAVTPAPTPTVQEDARAEWPPAEVTRLETRQGGEPSVPEASAENPVTMVFMGYQSVEDEDETQKVLGLKGTVKAELVLIHDANGKTPPGEEREETGGPHSPDPAAAPPPAASPATPPSSKPPETSAASNGETEEGKGGVGEGKKEKQPCKCCSIM